MTIRAAHITLRNLRQNDGPRLSNDQKRDFLPLGRAFAMVELQCEDVRFGAVNTWMRSQILPQETPIFVATSSCAIDLACDVVGAVSKVVRTPIGGVAGSAVILPCPA
jgi:hypothetical protein